MADLGPAFGALAELFGPLVKRALGAFFATAFGMVTLSILAGVGCYFIAADGSVLRGLVAVLIALLCFGVLGVALSIKRAVGGALIEGFARLGLGSKTMHVLFGRMLAIDANDLHGERGVDVARTAERLPLVQAETALRGAVDWLLRAGDGSQLGFFRRKIRAAAVEKVSLVTLARFREEAAVSGGVNLVKVRDELAATIDRMIATMLDRALMKVTLVLVVAACVLSLGAAEGLHKLWT